MFALFYCLPFSLFPAHRDLGFCFIFTGFNSMICLLFTVLCRGPGPRFEPGTGGLEAGTMNTIDHHTSPWFSLCLWLWRPHTRRTGRWRCPRPSRHRWSSGCCPPPRGEGSPRRARGGRRRGCRGGGERAGWGWGRVSSRSCPATRHRSRRGTSDPMRLLKERKKLHKCFLTDLFDPSNTLLLWAN